MHWEGDGIRTGRSLSDCNETESSFQAVCVCVHKNNNIWVLILGDMLLVPTRPSLVYYVSKMVGFMTECNHANITNIYTILFMKFTLMFVSWMLLHIHRMLSRISEYPSYLDILNKRYDSPGINITKTNIYDAILK